MILFKHVLATWIRRCERNPLSACAPEGNYTVDYSNSNALGDAVDHIDPAVGAYWPSAATPEIWGLCLKYRRYCLMKERHLASHSGEPKLEYSGFASQRLPLEHRITYPL